MTRLGTKSPKELRGERRSQTARLLQQTHRLSGYIASMINQPELNPVERMNNILSTETPPDTIITSQDVARPMILGVVLGFPSLVFVFLFERFGKNKTVMRRFGAVMRKTVKEYKKKGITGLNILPIPSLLPIGYNVKPGQTSDEALLEHLRNVFAHGSWVYDEKKAATGEFTIQVVDYFPSRTSNPRPDDRSFEAEADLLFLLALVERMLLVAFKYMA